MPLGEKIKNIRTEKDLTQKEFADQLFVSRQTISNWENNKSYPSVDFIESISKTFSVPIEDLLAENIGAENKRSINTEPSKEEIISKNKDRVVLNRLLFLRLVLAFIGSLVTSYFYFSNRHLEYIGLPIFFVLLGLSFSIPIRSIQIKYHLKDKEDLARFLDELYY